MTFRRGFVVTADTLVDPNIQDAAGQPATVDGVSTPDMILQNTLVEVDDAYLDRYKSMVRTAVPGHDNRYFVATVFTTDLQDVRATHAVTRIMAIEQVKGLATVREAAPGWVQRGVVLRWTQNPPDGLTVNTPVKVVAAGEDSITVHPESGSDVAVPMSKVQLADIAFERTSEEITERAQKLETNKDLGVLPYEQAIAMLANVPLLAVRTSNPRAVPITVADTSEEFEAEFVAYLMRVFRSTKEKAQKQVALVNGYTDNTGGTSRIFLRPGAQGVGTEVHESVHSLCNAAFETNANASFFLSEGITEYFTRMATVGTFERDNFYDTEQDFVDQLVKLNASTPQILANLYFDGDWAGFHQGLYAYAELVSIRVLLDKAASDLSYAALDYLKELKNDPEAPLQLYQ
jgi:hypothetical protein